MQDIKYPIQSLSKEGCSPKWNPEVEGIQEVIIPVTVWAWIWSWIDH
jgi:hypothetical protein